MKERTIRPWRPALGTALVLGGLILARPAAAQNGGMGDMKMDMQMAAKVAPIPPGSDYTAADVEFMQGMIGHHAQALQMTAMAGSHGASASVALLCKKITISQGDEIVMMRNWLADRHQPAPDPRDAHPMMMPGMLTHAQMAQLDSARGTAFDSLFLKDMIQHHAGALLMVKKLFASPGAGQEPEMFRYASDVDADQRAEINRMQHMLNSLKGTTE